MLTADGARRARHGNVLPPEDLTPLERPLRRRRGVRLLDESGGRSWGSPKRPPGGLLHPVIVLV